MVQVERDKLAGIVNNIPDEVWFADKIRNLHLLTHQLYENLGFIGKILI